MNFQVGMSYSRNKEFFEPLNEKKLIFNGIPCLIVHRAILGKSFFKRYVIRSPMIQEDFISKFLTFIEFRDEFLLVFRL